MSEESEEQESELLMDAVMDLIKSNCELMRIISILADPGAKRSKNLAKQIHNAHILYAKAKNILNELGAIEEQVIQ